MLLNHYSEDGANVGEYTYPDYYAGAYIHQTNGHLVIMVKNIDNNKKQEILDICKNENITFEEVNYTLSELLQYKMELEATAISLSERTEGAEIRAISIQEDKNKLFVGVSQQMYESLKESKTMLFADEAAPIEYYVQDAPRDYTTLTPGYGISATMPGSAAFYGKITYEGTTRWGFFTAAHVAGYDSYAYLSLFTKAGQIIARQTSTSVDAAFVEMTGYGHSFSNKIDGIQITPGVFLTPAIGSVVYKVGNTTNTTSGTVLSNLNTSYWKVNGVTYIYRDLCEATTYCEEGDSGGLMYQKTANTVKVVGVIKGGSDGKYYATKASYLPWGAQVT